MSYGIGVELELQDGYPVVCGVMPGGSCCSHVNKLTRLMLAGFCCQLSCMSWPKAGHQQHKAMLTSMMCCARVLSCLQDIKHGDMLTKVDGTRISGPVCDAVSVISHDGLKFAISPPYSDTSNNYAMCLSGLSGYGAG